MSQYSSMNMLTQNNNIGNLASVEGLPFTEEKLPIIEDQVM